MPERPHHGSESPSEEGGAQDKLLASRLRVGLGAFRPNPPPQVARQCQAYLKLLQKWNRAYNLTAVRDPLQMVPQHILDSLTLLPYLKGDHCLDVGTGPGLPGLVLAINNPRQHWCLLDSNGKKTRFLRQAVTELELPNIEIIHSRVEEYKPRHLFTTIVCRAYAPLAAYVQSVSHLAASKQTVLAMKASLPPQELRELQQLRIPYRIQKLTVPGLAAERNLVIME